MTVEPKRDEYGNAILPGYRKPFQKGDDPRRFKGRARYKCLTQADASRVLSKLEKLVDDLRQQVKRPKRGYKPHLQRQPAMVEPAPVSPVIAPVCPVTSPINPTPIPPVVLGDTADDCPF